MKRNVLKFGILLGVLLLALHTVWAATVKVTPNNLQGWSFYSESPPINFDDSLFTTGSSSLQFSIPLGSSPVTKFIMYPPIGNISATSLQSLSYDIYVDPTSTGGIDNFYINVYIDLDGFTNSWYDCRYDYVPTGGTGWNSFTVTTTTVPGPSSQILAGCPATLSGLTASDRIMFFAINGGQSTDSDNGLVGGFDNVAFTIGGTTTTYDFESGRFAIGPNGEQVRVRVPLDDRINYWDEATPIAAYPHVYDNKDNQKGIKVYAIQPDSTGVFVWEITPEMIAAVPEEPEENTLIGETTTDTLDIYFFRLESGEFQFNVVQPNGKMYVLIFSEIVRGGGGYTSSEYEIE